jgi:hypothetical protein
MSIAGGTSVASAAGDDCAAASPDGCASSPAFAPAVAADAGAPGDALAPSVDADDFTVANPCGLGFSPAAPAPGDGDAAGVGDGRSSLPIDSSSSAIVTLLVSFEFGDPAWRFAANAALPINQRNAAEATTTSRVN